MSRLSGNFEGLDFELASSDTRRTARISAGGRPLVESTLVHGIETTTYLDRLTLFGSPRAADPYMSGDRRAMAELARMPEARLFQPLRDALAARGIARDLYAAPRPAKGTPQPWRPTTLGYQQQVALPTWSWWFHVAIDVWSWSGPATLEVHDGEAVQTDTVYGWKRWAGVWSRWMVSVKNLGRLPLGVDGVLV